MSRMGVSHSFTDRGDVRLNMHKAHSKSKILSPIGLRIQYYLTQILFCMVRQILIMSDA